MSTRTNYPRGPKAISAAFDIAHSQNRPALIAYLTLGYPSPAESPALVLALQEGGADLIELGVPFSDPVADGPAIQRASQVALEAGTTPRLCLELVAAIRRAGVTVPLILMGYYNPMYAYGIRAYVRDSAAAGVDGLIVPDLPLEEAGPLREACRHDDLALTLLIAPTSGEARIAHIAAATQGFLYVISRLGTTGTQHQPAHELLRQLEMVRRFAHTPIAIGFGISSPEHIRMLSPHVDGIIVGSAIVERAAQGAQALREYVASLRATQNF